MKRELLEDFHKQIATESIDVADYGYIIKSGRGKDPPDDIIKKIKQYCPSYTL